MKINSVCFEICLEDTQSLNITRRGSKGPTRPCFPVGQSLHGDPSQQDDVPRADLCSLLQQHSAEMEPADKLAATLPHRRDKSYYFFISHTHSGPGGLSC